MPTKILQGLIQKNTQTPLPEILNETFISSDKLLADRPGMYSGCTAAVALLKVQDVDSSDDSGMDVTMDDASSTTTKRANGQPTGKRVSCKEQKMVFIASCCYFG